MAQTFTKEYKQKNNQIQCYEENIFNVTVFIAIPLTVQSSKSNKEPAKTISEYKKNV